VADFTQTINNYLLISAADPTTQWGTLVWGTDNWRSNQDVVVEIGKVIAETITNTTALNFDVTKLIEVEDLNLTSAVIKDYTGPTIAESLTLTNVQDGLVLIDSAGFYHVFRGNTTEGEDQIISDYTEESADTTSWTPASDPSTSWS
jgi:hypothetical protein